MSKYEIIIQKTQYIENNSQGSNTQYRAKRHEEKALNIHKDFGGFKSVEKQEFKDFQKKNKFNLKEIKFNSNYKGILNIPAKYMGD
jgi:hypothetical protein